MPMELLGYKKTPVRNRGFVPGLPRSYNLIGPDAANVQGIESKQYDKYHVFKLK